MHPRAPGLHVGTMLALALSALTLAPPLPGADLVFERILDPAQQPAGASPIQPVGVHGLAGDDRLFVTEMTGRVRIVRDGQVLATPFVDVTAHVVATGLAGLRATTFHPDFAANGHVYLWYDALEPGGSGEIDLVLGRVTRDPANPDVTDPQSLVELMRIRQDARGHGGGAIAFGPDGMLWIGVGDGGVQDDPHCRAQDLSSRLGKVLRIDVDAASPYAVPPDNPFVGTSGAAPEIAHVGFRHPWKWSFDRATGDLWIADVGQWEREEVDFVRAGILGLNFGWTSMEGTACHAAPGCGVQVPGCAAPVFTPPLFEYDHSVGCSITGGHVYRGTRFPELVGAYVCTDFCTRRFWTLRQTAGVLTEADQRVVTFEPPGVPAPSVSSFGEDGDGELLLVDHATGALFRLRRPCGAATTCHGEPNVTGNPGVLRFHGTSSLGANDASISLASLPQGTPTQLVYGPAVADVPLGNGRLCVGGAIVRIGVRFADLRGRALFPLDLTAAPFDHGPGQVLVGSTWTFQAWYRDVGGPLGAASNLTSATTVTFCP